MEAPSSVFSVWLIALCGLSIAHAQRYYIGNRMLMGLQDEADTATPNNLPNFPNAPNLPNNANPQNSLAFPLQQRIQYANVLNKTNPVYQSLGNQFQNYLRPNYPNQVYQSQIYQNQNYQNQIYPNQNYQNPYGQYQGYAQNYQTPYDGRSQAQSFPISSQYQAESNPFKSMFAKRRSNRNSYSQYYQDNPSVMAMNSEDLQVVSDYNVSAGSRLKDIYYDILAMISGIIDAIFATIKSLTSIIL